MKSIHGANSDGIVAGKTQIIKRMIAVFMCVCIIVLSISFQPVERVFAAPATGTTTWTKEEVAKVNTLYIGSAADWDAFARLSTSTGGKVDYAGKTIYLTEDITLSGSTQTVNNFKGAFDGQGFVINLSGMLTHNGDGLNDSGDDAAIGLFRHLRASASVKNVTVNVTSDVTFPPNADNTKTNYNGVLVGFMNTTAGITDCTVKSANPNNAPKVYADFADRAKGGYIGAIAGRAVQGTISGCYTDIRVEGEKSDDKGIAAGGIVGGIEGSVTVSDCLVMNVARADYTGNTIVASCTYATQNAYAGGIVGKIVDGRATITDNYVAGMGDSYQMIAISAIKNGGSGTKSTGIIAGVTGGSNVSGNKHLNVVMYANTTNETGTTPYISGDNAAGSLSAAWKDVQGLTKAMLSRLAVETVVEEVDSSSGGAANKTYNFTLSKTTPFTEPTPSYGGKISYTKKGDTKQTTDTIGSATVQINSLEPGKSITGEVYYSSGAYGNRFSAITKINSNTKPTMGKPVFSPKEGSDPIPSGGVTISSSGTNPKILYADNEGALQDKYADAIVAGAHSYSKGLKFPSETLEWTLYARAYSVDEDKVAPSDIASITYNAKINKPIGTAPTLLVTPVGQIEKVNFDPDKEYDPGTKIFINTSEFTTGTFYYTLNGDTPSSSSIELSVTSAKDTAIKVLDNTQATVDVKLYLAREYEPNTMTGTYEVKILPMWKLPAASVRSGQVASGTEVMLAPHTDDMKQPPSGGLSGFTEDTKITKIQEAEGDLGEMTPADIKAWLIANIKNGKLENTVVFNSIEEWGKYKDVYIKPPWVYYVVGTSQEVSGKDPIINGVAYIPATPNVLVKNGNDYLFVHLLTESPSSPITINGAPGQVSEVKAAVKNDPAGTNGAKRAQSDVNTFTYTIRNAPKAITATPKGTDSDGNMAVIPANTNITLSCTTSGTTIYYTIDGSSPQVEWNGAEWTCLGSTLPYQSSIVASGASSVFTINAIVVSKTNILEPGEEQTFAYRMADMEIAAVPTAYPATSGPNYTQILSGDTITLDNVNVGGQIYYTKNGTKPNPEAYEEWAAGEANPENKPDTEKYTENGIVVQFTSNEITIIAVSTGLGLKESVPVRFTYWLKKAQTPTSIPVTLPDKVTTVASGTMIILSTDTPGASICYTEDNTTPIPSEADVEGKSTKIYVPSKGIVMTDTPFFNIRAISYTPSGAANLYRDSDPAYFTYQTPAQLQAVYTSPGAGKVENNSKVSLKTSSEGARIFYRLFNSEPGASETVTPNKDMQYDEANPIIITKNTWIMTISELNGAKSQVMTYLFEVAPTLPKPTASVKSGSTVAKNTPMTLSGNASETIVYTKDGSDPKGKDNKALCYGGDVVIDGEYGATVTIKACSTANEHTPSDVVTFTYTIAKEADVLKTTPPEGATVKAGTEIKLSTTLSDAKIYYTTDGSAPTTSKNSGNVLTAKGKAGESLTVKVLIVAGGNRIEKSLNYTMMSQTQPPKSSIASGSITLDGAKVTLSAPEGSIYYTTDGTNPTQSSQLYTDPIDVSQTMLLKAIAVAGNKEVSSIVEYTYTRAGQAAAPLFSKTSGEIVLKTLVEISTATEGGQIYYTTDGTDPKADNLSVCTIYSGPITITRPVTIKAIAIKEKQHPSLVNTVTYTVVEPPPVVEEDNSDEIQKVTTTDRLVSRRDYSEENIGPTLTDIVLNNTTHNVVIGATDGGIPKDTKLNITSLTSTESDVKAVDTELGYGIVSLYDVSLESEGLYIQPSGEVELGLPIPPEYANAIVVICSIGDDGTVTAFPTRRAGNTAYIKTSHFSKYAITAPIIEQSNGLSTTLIAVLTAVGIFMLIAAGFLVWRFIKRKKAK